jgi:hypothetical protein
MRISLIVVSLILSGCANAPVWLAEIYDSQDPCQQRNYYKQGGQEPRYCGAGSAGRTVIYATPTNNPIGAPVGYTKKN